MSIERGQLVLVTVVCTLSVCCWLLTIVSCLAVWDPIWKLIGLFHSTLYNIGLAGHGHSLLKGMSRAFRSIWMGDLQTAYSFNQGSVALFIVMLVGCAIGPVVFIFARQRKIKTWWTE
jgi:hypothetical protein